MKSIFSPFFSSLAVLLIITGGHSVSRAELVTITQVKSGRSIKVDVIGVESGVLSFSTGGGKDFKIPVADLTPDTVDRLKKLLANRSESNAPPQASEAESAAAKNLNEQIGHSLMGDVVSLWTEDAGDIAKRLEWKLESRKENISSYRRYTKKEYLFLGAHPYCVTLYGGEGGRPERFSLIYANKGDFGSRLGVGEDHFRVVYPDDEPPGDLDEAIEFDAKKIAERLTNALGEPTQQYYGEKEDKRKVKRWDLGEQAFLLSTLEREYTHLLIVPTSNADVQGKVRFIVDSVLKKVKIKNVRREENGDVWIDNIPMVDQGPKGYCAPATFERAMRYMHVPADMYLLATAATTAQGTNTTQLAADCKRIVRSKARRIKDLEMNEDFNFKTLKRYVDKGVPILWQMRSLSGYNIIANTRTKERESVSDFQKWASEIKEEAQFVAGRLRTQDAFHICMIIGYNEKTQEVAVSDSWGPRYELRWVHIEVAKAVTSRGGFVIDF